MLYICAGRRKRERKRDYFNKFRRGTVTRTRARLSRDDFFSGAAMGGLCRSGCIFSVEKVGRMVVNRDVYDFS